MEDIKGNIEKLRPIRDLGGISPLMTSGQVTRRLGILAKLPVNALRSTVRFIITMAKDRDSMNIVSTIISTRPYAQLEGRSRRRGFRGTVATPDTIKGDEIQGYLFSKPLPARASEAKFLGAENLTFPPASSSAS